MKELSPPLSIVVDDSASEVLRVWSTAGRQVFVINPHQWKDPGAWGILMADLVEQVASAYEAKGLNRDEVYLRIMSLLAAEIKKKDGPS